MLNLRDKRQIRDVFLACAPGMIVCAVGGYVSFVILQKDVAASQKSIEGIEIRLNSEHEAIAEIRGNVKVLLDRSDREQREKK